MTGIVVNQVGKRYGDFVAVGDVDLTVPDGFSPDALPFLLWREIRAPTARPARAKKPYLTNRASFGSRELMALRASLASALPSFQAVFPATLPAFGATLAPIFAPSLAPFLFLLANSLPPSSRSRFLGTSYPE